MQPDPKFGTGGSPEASAFLRRCDTNCDGDRFTSIDGWLSENITQRYA